MIACIFAAALLVAFTSAEGQSPSTPPAPTLWATLKPGPHQVGYRQLQGRTGVVHTWYPAAESKEVLRFSDYAGSSGTQLRAFLNRVGLSGPTIDSLFSSRLFASSSPLPAPGVFPLVLIAHGNGQDVVDQVILCEYLASLGFVVAAPPSPTLRLPMEREDQVGAFAEMQASDLDDAMGIVAKTLPVDRARVGIVGHSFGARAALLLVMRQPEIDAIASLDGGIGTNTAVEHFRRTTSFRADAPVAAVLHFYEELDQFMTPDFTLLRSLQIANLDLVRTSDLRHTHFTTYGFLAGSFEDIARATRASPATATAIADVAVRTGAFFRRLLQ